MTSRVALVYFEGCPHADAARGRMQEALSRVGMPLSWEEWDTTREGTPIAYRRFGSPTVLVDGTDVNGGVEGAGLGCVVGGGPTVETIVRALRQEQT